MINRTNRTSNLFNLRVTIATLRLNVFRDEKRLKVIFWIISCGGFIVLNIAKAVNSPAAIYKLAKIIELILFAYYLKNNINIKKDIKKIVYILSLSVIWQSVLSLGQWFKQSSIFGYWFFGEQPYNTATIGIKIIDFFGRLKIAPLGTFPHPNILAGFLVISLIIILSYSDRDRRLFWIKFGAVILGTISLLLTFSFPAWMIFLIISGWQLGIRKRKDLVKIIMGVGLIGVILLIRPRKILTYPWEKTSLTRRISLNQISAKMWASSPIFGVGLNNFIVRMEDFGQISGNIRFLQPVHNIYLLILAETGIIGMIGLIWLIKTIWNKKRSQKLSFFYPLAAILFLGLFDHYFLTIQQGMLILALVLGLS